MSEQFTSRFNTAKRSRDLVKKDLRELYKFVFNGREGEWDDTTRRHEDADEIYSTTADEANIDFASDLCTYFTPDTAPWIDFEVGVAIPEELEQQVLDLVSERERHLLRSVASSNYYDVCHAAFSEAGHGTVGLWVDRPSITSAILVEPIPASELYFSIGPRGVEDRFRKRRLLSGDLPALFPNVQWDDDMARKIAKRDANVTICWGYWRDYSIDAVNPSWMHEAQVDGKTIISEDLGPGASCPLLIGRFNPQPGLPWGRGPAWKMLPEIRTLDELRYLLLDKIDQHVDPAWLYPDDGLLDLSQGVQSGMAYPAMPGSADEVRELTSKGNVDYGFFTQEDLEERIRRGFYQDGPRQRGKTPPSATQWLEEVQRIQRRLGKPAQPLWSELVVPLIKRFEWLDVEIGLLDETLAVNELVITVRPVSPLIRSQNQEEIARAQQLLELATANLGEQAALVIDGPATFANMKRKSGDEIVVIRSEQQMLALAQGLMGGAGAEQ